MNKERLAQCKETLRRNKFFGVLDIIEQLERENEILKRILNWRTNGARGT